MSTFVLKDFEAMVTPWYPEFLGPKAARAGPRPDHVPFLKNPRPEISLRTSRSLRSTYLPLASECPGQ